MFDGLKDKLSSFRKDTAEDLEEKAERADEEDTDADASADAETDAASPATDESSPASAESTPDSGPGSAGPDVGAGAVETDRSDAPSDAADESGRQPDERSAPAEGDEESTANTPAAASAVTDRSDADESESEPEEEESAASRFQRAKAFATGRIIIEEEDLEEPLWNLEMALLESDVELSVAEEMLATIREKMLGEARAQVDTTEELVTNALHDALLDVISVGQFDFEERLAQAEKPVTVVFTGVNGVGKTTSIAKFTRWLDARGYSSVMANGDTYRAGANEQIREHADRLDGKLISHEQGGDPAAVLYDAVEYAEAHDVDVVLGDTAGRLHTSNDLMAQLEKIDRVVDPDLTLFVDEAVAGQDAVQRAKKFDEAAAIDGAVLTKADADSSGGAAISIAYVTGKPVLFLGTGQGYDDLRRFDPEALVDELVGGE
ncbi:signal recognition particle-docking protein FtsY [Candidatus Halobonum tyrrellensis]|uniref:Signal recognition particle receptor FtsY n=1 Tax=Candidatus Halobonum tyrrellensis G22 TaxID=1324957 RepID=V4HBR9_9EURY|nr:signal recognition particle-docking protein FtsY [Candidatus Halobonum tyrrellensis]ESP87493.1 cell division protein FtsY [Candidatus Halobonum tyrrellensis G22]